MISDLFNKFFHSEKSSGIILIFCTILSLTLTNVGFQPYVDLWQFQVADHSIVHWINDGLMVIFFLLIGLELEREIYAGELSSLRNALLPVFAAAGGMLFPAGIYLVLNLGGQSSGGRHPNGHRYCIRSGRIIDARETRSYIAEDISHGTGRH